MDFHFLSAEQSDFADRLRTLRTPPIAPPAVRQQVEAMEAHIREEGDKALLDYTEQFDCHRPPSVAELEVPPEALRTAESQVDAGLRHDLQTAAARLHDYHSRQQPTDWFYSDEHGNRLGERVRPVRRAVIYAPGGKAAYPSSVLMGVIPAVVAGVEEIILTTPAPGGTVPPITLVAAKLAGVHRIFLLGGAQAIIGFALGSETLPVADVIVGPGNAYVAEAKRQMFGRVGLDSIAGPSEVLILSDGSAPIDWIVADMAAQAEHDEEAQSMLLSPDRAHIDAVAVALAEFVESLPRRDIIRQSLANRGLFLHAPTLDDCCRIADDIAAEHLHIMTDKPETVANRIQNGGGFFIGHHSCVAFGDYLAGPNHILPTAGTAVFASPLGVGHFCKRSGYLQASAAGASALADTTARLADAEGLSAHAHAARKRK